jgi:hypothetical protein
MMNLADERVRERLAQNGPVGRWKTVPGTHVVLFDESIRFDADGSGEMRQYSELGGARQERFRWRSEERGTVMCQLIDDEPMLSDVGEPETTSWFRIRFCFERHETDVGSFWVMRERGTEGFWELMMPLVPA